MSLRLSDEQITKAESSVRKVIREMIQGKVAINWRDHKRNSKTLYNFGSVTSRHLLRVINDLKHYKSQVEEMQKTLENALNDLEQKAKEAYAKADATEYGKWIGLDYAAKDVLQPILQSLKGETYEHK